MFLFGYIQSITACSVLISVAVSHTPRLAVI